MKKLFLYEIPWVIGFILCFIFLKTSVIGFYLVPSTSMMPNIISGDRIFTNKLAYGLWIPFLNTPLFTWSEPKRGEIILFNSPNGEGTFVKRVIGLPGDTITFHQGIPNINGTPLTQNAVSVTILEKDYNTKVFAEESTSLSFPPHYILVSLQPGSTFFESERYLVPPNKLFVMGDNRDNSVDSRSFGFVDEQSIYGKVNFVLFSTSGSNSFFPEFRSDRFFKKIN